MRTPLVALAAAFVPSRLVPRSLPSQHRTPDIASRRRSAPSDSLPTSEGSAAAPSAAGSFSTRPGGAQLGLLTFDLDDTLFPISPVVREANEAMVRAILGMGYSGVTNEDVVAATRAIRSELSKTDSAIRYTDLRVQAVLRELRRCLEGLGGPGGDAVHVSVAERIFDVWLAERHASAERNLYAGALDVLDALRSEHPGVTIGAVTNGRGNPLDMAGTLGPYFDFCVSGEDEGVFPLRKPHRGIYEAALARFAEVKSTGGLEEGRCWVHVGDDLANDVGASAACGAKAIWLDMEDDGCETSTSRQNGANPSWSTASTKEIEKRKKMALEAQESVSNRITRLSELPAAVRQVLEEAN